MSMRNSFSAVALVLAFGGGQAVAETPGLGKPITSIDHAYTHFKITLYAFECKLVSGKPQALQVQDFKWVRMSELEKYAFAKTDLRIIEALKETY